MTEGNSKEQLDKDMEQFLIDLKDLEKEIDMIGKRYKSWNDMTEEDFNSLLIRTDGIFELSSPLKDRYDIREINV